MCLVTDGGCFWYGRATEEEEDGKRVRGQINGEKKLSGKSRQGKRETETKTALYVYKCVCVF